MPGWRGRGLRRRLVPIVRDTGWVGTGELIKLLTGLVVLNVLIIGLGPAAYGRFVAVQVLSSVLTMMSCSWVTFLLLQHTLQGGRDLRTAYGTALGLAAPASAAAFLLGSLVGPLLVPALDLWVIACFVAAELLVGLLLTLSGAAVQIDKGLPAAARLRMLQHLTRAAVVVSVAVAGTATLETLAPALLAGYAAVSVTVFVVTTKRLGLRRVPARPRWKQAKEGLPYAGVLVSLAIQEDSDKVFLVRFADPVDAGLYAAAYRLVQLGFIPISALMGSSHPRFLTRTAGLRNEHLRRALRYTGPTALYGVVATLAVVIFAPVVPQVLGEEFEGTQLLLAVLAPLILLRTLSLFPLNALLGLRRLRLRLAVIVATTAVNVAMNAALVPLLGVPGAVASTLVTEAVLVVLVWTVVIKAQRREDQAQAGTDFLDERGGVAGGAGA